MLYPKLEELFHLHNQSTKGFAKNDFIEDTTSSLDVPEEISELLWNSHLPESEVVRRITRIEGDRILLTRLYSLHQSCLEVKHIEAQISESEFEQFLLEVEMYKKRKVFTKSATKNEGFIFFVQRLAQRVRQIKVPFFAQFSIVQI